MIREGKIPEEFNKNPEMLWTDFFTPLLEKALKSSYEEACPSRQGLPALFRVPCAFTRIPSVLC